VVESSGNINQSDRVSVTLDVDFRTPLIGGLPTCSELCRRRKAMRSTLASVSRGSASSKARNSSGHWHEHHMMAQFSALFGVTQEQAYRSIRSNRRQGIPSPGLARSDRTSPSSFIRSSSAWPARRRSLAKQITQRASIVITRIMQ